jgi:hypothetical protein
MADPEKAPRHDSSALSPYPCCLGFPVSLALPACAAFDFLALTRSASALAASARFSFAFPSFIHFAFALAASSRHCAVLSTIESSKIAAMRLSSSSGNAPGTLDSVRFLAPDKS